MMRLRYCGSCRLRRFRRGWLRCGVGCLGSRFLGCGRGTLRIGGKGSLKLTCNGRFDGGRCGLDEFAHRLKFVQNGFAVNAKFLGKFIYACFRHSILLSWAARIRARPLLIHGELVPSHRATMFVIPRLFPEHDGGPPYFGLSSPAYSSPWIVHPRACSLLEVLFIPRFPHGIWPAIPPSSWHAPQRIRYRSSNRSVLRPDARSDLPCRWRGTAGRRG